MGGKGSGRKADPFKLGGSNVGQGGNTFRLQPVGAIKPDALKSSDADISFTGTQGSVPFVGSDGNLTESNTSFFWDDTNKRLGIGTNIPQEKFHVVMTTDMALFEGTTANASVIIGNTGADAGKRGYGINAIDSDVLLIQALNDDYSFVRNLIGIEHDGNVGIGTIIPDNKLTVAGDADVTGKLGIGTNTPGELLEVSGNAGFIEVNHAAANSFGGIKWSEGGTPQGTIQIVGSNFVTASRRGDLEIFTAGSTGNVNFQIAGGNVGIGLIAPQEALAIKNTGNIVMDKASGFGIKVDNTTPTFGFADLLGDQFAKNTGASKPILTTYNGDVQAFKFEAGDEAYMSFHIPHDYVPGTDIFLHVHWSHTATTVSEGTVTFQASSIYSKSHNQAAFSAPAVSGFNGTASTTQYQQILTETQYSASSPTGLQIDTDNLEPDGVIEMTLKLSSNDIVVTGGGVPDPFIHFIDVHYQTTGLIGTKAKAPDFYA